MSRATTLRRLAKQEDRLMPEASPVMAWLEAYRRGASIAERNKAGGEAWVAMAEERQRLAAQTLADYGENDGNESDSIEA